MLSVRTTTRFLRDQKSAGRRGHDIDKLEAIVNLLQAQKPLPIQNKDHALSGEWTYHRECHIEPDWLLIYTADEKYLTLHRTGSHADLFE